MYRVEYCGSVIVCNSKDELEHLLGIIRQSHRESPFGGYPAAPKNPWKAEVFWRFVEKLGTSQERVIKMLLKDKASDDELRKTLGLQSNKQLAGILSGISKQAAAHQIPARAVFVIENESRSGEVTKTYAIAPQFVEIAAENNWPVDISEE
jgi:hypothetical protein